MREIKDKLNGELRSCAVTGARQQQAVELSGCRALEFRIDGSPDQDTVDSLINSGR